MNATDDGRRLAMVTGAGNPGILTAEPVAPTQGHGPAANGAVAGTGRSGRPAGPASIEGSPPRLDPIKVRCEVVHIHAVLPQVTYRGPHPPHRRHWARVVIDFDPDPQCRLSVDTASLKALRRWLRGQLLSAEDLAACVAQAVADTVGVVVDVVVTQRQFNRVQLTPTGRGYPDGGQTQQAAEPNG
jgi:hypothetical protein